MSAKNDRDWLTIGGLVLVGVAAAVTSFTELVGLAKIAGWKHHLSLLLPANVDVYGFTATRIWLSQASTDEVKKHARVHALIALLLSMAGNAINHAVEAKALVLGSNAPTLIIVVALIPPATLGALMHLVTLRGRDHAKPPEVTVPSADRANGRVTVPTGRSAAGGSVGLNRAIETPRPSQPAYVTVPSTEPLPAATAPVTEPSTVPEPVGTVEADRANRATPEPGSVPPEVRPGVTPPDYVLDAARTIYTKSVEDGRALTDRKLAVATRDRFDAPHAVIGRSACQKIIAAVERDEATG